MSIHLASTVWKTELGGHAVKAVAMKLADCADDDGTSIWPSVFRIARETETSERTVQMALKTLVKDIKLIVVVEKGGKGPGSPTSYRMDLTVLARLRAETQARWDKEDAERKGAKSAPFKKADKGAKSALKGAKIAAKGAAPADNPSLPVIDPSNNNAPPEDASGEKPKRANKKQRLEQFEAFWQAFPLKKGKAKARERFDALSPEDADRAIAGAKSYAAECATEHKEARYIKWPEGWLNARRFEDATGDPCEALTGPDGQRWGWWRGREDKLRAMPIERWRAAFEALRPNGEWPWWKLTAPPGHPECLMPECLVKELGLAEIYKGQISHA